MKTNNNFVVCRQRLQHDQQSFTNQRKQHRRHLLQSPRNKKLPGREIPQLVHLFNAIIKVKPQPKKAKSTQKEEKEISGNEKPASQIDRTSLDSAKGNVTGSLTYGAGAGFSG